MKTLEEIKVMRDELAEEHASKVRDEGDWHSVEAQQSFILGFDTAIDLMEERERMANVCLDGVMALLKEEKKFDTEFVLDFIQKGLNALNNKGENK